MGWSAGRRNVPFSLVLSTGGPGYKTKSAKKTFFPGAEGFNFRENTIMAV